MDQCPTDRLISTIPVQQLCLRAVAQLFTPLSLFIFISSAIVVSLLCPHYANGVFIM